MERMAEDVGAEEDNDSCAKEDVTVVGAGRGDVAGEERKAVRAVIWAWVRSPTVVPSCME